MRKLVMVCVLVLLVSTVLFAQIRSGTNAWISAQSATLRASGWVFAANRGKLEYADEVKVLQTSGKWAEVRSVENYALSGWVSVSSLSTRRILPSGAGADVSEIALAGKGFSQELEDIFRAQGDLNYADVDKTEAITVSMDELYQFIRAGRLNAGE